MSLDNARLYTDLQRSEAFLAQGQKISHTGTFGWSVATGEIYWSEENYNILEYDRSAGATLDLAFHRVHPDDRDFVRQTLEQAIRDKSDFDVEHRLLMPDGRIKHVHIIGRAVETGNLEFVGAVTDVTVAETGGREDPPKREGSQATSRLIAAAHHRIGTRRGAPLHQPGFTRLLRHYFGGMEGRRLEQVFAGPGDK